jgi:hypothetical protein
VDPHNVTALIEGMVRLATALAFRQALAETGPPTARRFSWTATAHRHTAYYRTILKQRETTL